MPTDELTTRLAAVYAQCLTAAATMCVADRTKPEGDYPMMSYAVSQLADEWFKNALREGAIAAFNFEVVIADAAKANNLRKRYEANE